jgi:hypothetical protein
MSYVSPTAAAGADLMRVSYLSIEAAKTLF